MKQTKKTKHISRINPWPCQLCDGLVTSAMSASICGQTKHSAPICQSCFTELASNRNACIQCAMPLTIAAQRCGACQKRPPAIDIATVPFRYANPLSELMQDFKFNQRLDYGLTLSQLLADVLLAQMQSLDADSKPAAIIPIPLHKQRLRQRGYDQSLEIARVLGHILDIPVWDHHLQRQKMTAPFTSMNAVERRRAIRGAFEWSKADHDMPAHVAIVDDVMTTGSTLSECAKTLKKHGAELVQAWAVLRALPARH